MLQLAMGYNLKLPRTTPSFTNYTTGLDPGDSRSENGKSLLLLLLLLLLLPLRQRTRKSYENLSVSAIYLLIFHQC